MINKILKKIKILWNLNDRKNKTKKLSLKTLSDSNSRKVVSILKEIINESNWDKDEVKQFEKINLIRNGYANSQEVITTIDYGAGASNSTRSLETQDSGVLVTQKVSDIHKIASSKEKWGKLIFKLIREYKPNQCLELGTCLGVSAAYQILALKLNESGNLITIEGSTERAEIAKNTLHQLDSTNHSVLSGKFSDILPDLLNTHTFDFVFIDGHHDREATLNYFEMIYPSLDKTAIVIFDDINWSTGMNEAWKKIILDERVKQAFDLYNWGLCFIDKENNLEAKKYELGI